MSLNDWNDRTPSRRCDWLDLVRGWAVIVMIEVHCVNVWLPVDAVPAWLQYQHGAITAVNVERACILHVVAEHAQWRPFSIYSAQPYIGAEPSG